MKNHSIFLKNRKLWKTCLTRNCVSWSISFLEIIHLVSSKNYTKKLTFLTPRHTRTSAYQGLRNISFSDDFVNVQNELSANYNIWRRCETKQFQLLRCFLCTNFSCEIERHIWNSVKDLWWSFFAKIVHYFRKKSSIIDVWHGSRYL